MVATTLPGVLLYGVAGSRPAANAVANGTLYSATDTGTVTQSDGVSTWSTFLSVSATGIPATIVDVKGDLIVASAADTVARLAAGANGTRPEAASGETTGIKWSYPPGYELNYVEITSNATATATTEATANTIITAGALAFDGSTIALIEFWCALAQPAASAGANMKFYLADDTGGGAASIGRIGTMGSPAANNAFESVHLKRRMTPSSATHTFSIRASVSTGTGTVYAAAGGGGADTVMPAFIRITRA